MPYKYSNEQINWLRQNYPLEESREETTRRFNETFNLNKSCYAIRSFAQTLGLKKNKFYYTNEQIEWVKQNWENDETREETVERFNKIFNEHCSVGAIKTLAIRLGLKKRSYHFPKGHKTWNYGMSKEEMKEHFTDESWAAIHKNYSNHFPNIAKRLEWEKENGPIPKGYVLSDLGNGELMLMDKKIHKCLTYQKALGQGEYTKTMYELYLAKRKLEKKTGKLIVFNRANHQTREHMAEIRAKRTTYYKKLSDADIEAIKILKKTMTYPQLAELYKVNEKTIRNYLLGRKNYENRTK